MAQLLQVVGPRSGSAPLVYTITDAGTVDLQTVFAHFDGSGASGAYRPTLTIKAQNGTILARLFPATEPAAGDTADVTFSPFFRSTSDSPSAFTFPQVVAAYASTRQLRGYWRLGEAASPFLDTSGYSPSTPANQVRQVNGVPMTLDVPGALAPAEDDGAVRFNFAGTITSGNALADWLACSNGADGRFNFLASNNSGKMSAAAWVKPIASANTWLGGVLAAFNIVSSSPNYPGGWALYVSWPTLQPIFFRGGAGPSSQSVTGPALSTTDWTFLVATYDGTTIRLYFNTTLVGSQASGVGLPSMNEGANIGNMVGPPSGNYRGRFYGSIDEVTVWHDVLTATEIATLYQAGF